jgi:hypothetical protein
MKKLSLQLAVVAMLTLALVGLPMLVYTVPLKPTPLTFVQRDAHIQKPTADSKLIFFKRTNPERFIGFSIKQYPDLNANSVVYLTPTKQSTATYDTGDTYLFPSGSAVAQLIKKHPSEIATKNVIMAYSFSNDKYQIAGNTETMIELAKVTKSSQIVLNNLSEKTYQDILQQAKLDPDLNRIIVSTDPTNHTILLDPTTKKINAKFILARISHYFKSSVKLNHIFNDQ